MNEKGAIILTNNNYVLAMYDIRGKQKFIYECSSVKEIQGASLIIKDVYENYLHKKAKDLFGKVNGYGAQKPDNKMVK